MIQRNIISWQYQSPHNQIDINTLNQIVRNCFFFKQKTKLRLSPILSWRVSFGERPFIVTDLSPLLGEKSRSLPVRRKKDMLAGEKKTSLLSSLTLAQLVERGAVK